MPIVCARGHLGSGSLPLGWPQAQVVPDERVLSSFALPRDALVEFLVRHGLRVRIDCVRSTVRHLPRRRPPRRPQTRRLRRPAQVTENRLDHRRFGAEMTIPNAPMDVNRMICAVKFDDHSLGKRKIRMFATTMSNSVLLGSSAKSPVYRLALRSARGQQARRCKPSLR